MSICPDCNRNIKPSNLQRHRRTQHLPQPRSTTYGTRYTRPSEPIVGKGKDRRYDEFIPRGEGRHRFRIYRLRAGELELMHSCSAAEEVGTALFELHFEGEVKGDDSMGVLDTKTEPGHWIVNPFTLGRKKMEDE